MLKKERIFLWVGIALTVLSILITHSVVGKRSSQISEYLMLINESEKKIDRMWQRQQEIEHRGAISHLLSINKTEQSAQQFIENTLSYFSIDEVDMKSLSTLELIEKYTKLHQQKTIDAIDNIYIEKETISFRMHELEQQTELFKALALFLHVIGLVLVLYYRA